MKGLSRCLNSLLGVLMPLMLILLLAESCDVHEFPEEETEKTDYKFALHLRFDKDIPLFKDVYYENGGLQANASRSGRAPDYDIRYIINFYPAVRSGVYSRSAEHSFVMTEPLSHGLDADFELEVPPGDYRILVWTDYVGHGEPIDLFYNTSDFSEIMIADKQNYVGDDDYRDAFRGSLDVSIDYGPDYYLSRDKEVVVEGRVEMERPLAKYRFITTDLKEFLRQQTESRRSTRTPDEEGSDSRAISLSDYSVKVIYSQYLPCSFNMFTNRPADSWLGMSYRSTILQISDEEAEICFDYVFINGGESMVAVALEIYNLEDELVASTAPFNVPLKRTMLTEVRGTFLTTNSGGAIGIDPGYSGEFDVFIR